MIARSLNKVSVFSCKSNRKCSNSRPTWHNWKNSLNFSIRQFSEKCHFPLLFSNIKDFFFFSTSSGWHRSLHFVLISFSFIVTRCTTCCHSLTFVVLLVIICCHSLSLVVPLVVTHCHSMYHSFAFFKWSVTF